MSLRILLLLSAGGAKTADMLALADTIAVYGAEFGIAGENLHGCGYVLDEFDTRRELAKEAAKLLVRRGFANVERRENGFAFAVTEQGREFRNSLDSDYTAEYARLANAANLFVKNKTEREVFALISKTAERGLGDD